jgi:hypothetical protein
MAEGRKMTIVWALTDKGKKRASEPKTVTVQIVSEPRPEPKTCTVQFIRESEPEPTVLDQLLALWAKATPEDRQRFVMAAFLNHPRPASAVSPADLPF